MNCDCNEWKESMDQIIGAQQLAANHRMPYTGSEFLYCPWCGSELKEKIEEEGLEQLELPMDD